MNGLAYDRDFGGEIATYDLDVSVAAHTLSTDI